MTDLVRIQYAKPRRLYAGTVVAFAGPELALGPETRGLGLDSQIARAAAAAGFSGKSRSVLDLLAPAGADFDRLILVGTGAPDELGEKDWVDLGGVAAGALGKAKAVGGALRAARRERFRQGRASRLCPRHEAARLRLRQLPQGRQR